MTEAEQTKVEHQRPRTIWVFALAAGELATIVIVALLCARLGVAFPATSAILIAILASGFLGYRLERRYPGILTWKMRFLLAAQVSVLLAIVNGLAFYYRGSAPTLGYALMITGLGTLFMMLVHLVGFIAGLSTAKAARARS